MLLLSIINVLGVRLLAKTNILIVAIKLIVPGLTIVTLASIDFHPANFFSHGFAPMGF